MNHVIQSVWSLTLVLPHRLFTQSPVLGIAYIWHGKPSKAEAALKEAASRNSEFKEAIIWLGIAYIEQNKLLQAISTFKRVLDLDSSLTLAWQFLGDCYSEVGRLDEAKHAYAKSIEQSPDSIISLGNLLIYQMGQYQEAEKLYREYLKDNSPSEEILLEFARVLSRQGKFSEAKTTLLNAAKIKPESAKAWYQLGNLLEETMNYKDAENAYHKGIDIEPENPQGWLHLGYFLFGQNKIPEAEETARKALLLLDKDTSDYNYDHFKEKIRLMLIEPSLLLLGVALHAQNKFQEARHVYQRYLQYDKNDAWVWFHLGMIHLNLGEKDDAITALEHAQSLDPASYSFEINFQDSQNELTDELRKLRQDAERIRSDTYYLMHTAGESLESISKMQEIQKSLEIQNDEISCLAKQLLMSSNDKFRRILAGRESQEDAISDISKSISEICEKLGIGKTRWERMKSKLKGSALEMSAEAALWAIVKSGLVLMGLPL